MRDATADENYEGRMWRFGVQGAKTLIPGLLEVKGEFCTLKVIISRYK